MKKNTLIKRLKDNQSYKDAYTFVEENVDYNEKKIEWHYWDGILKEVCDINKLISLHKIVTIPPQNSYKNQEIVTRINDKLFTYNWVGVIVNRSQDGKDYRIEITSRFDSGEKQYFLLYLLCNVCGMNVFDININSETESNYLPILIILFFQKLVEAYGKGLYKEYVRKEYNDYGFRGTMDINRHIKYNNPFVGKTAYSTREYSYDNHILCLIRQTIDYIFDYYPAIGEGYIGNNPIVNEILDIVETATPSYMRNINYAESLKCRKEITHPMYKDYDDVRKLALMILNESGQNVFEDAEDDSFGILIDMAWLWEEFVATKLIDKKRYLHMLTDRTVGSIQWASGKNWYPDFLENGKDTERRNVLDAKYKRWDWNKHADVHQLLSYLYITGGEKCGVIYPNEELKEIESKELNAFHLFYDNAPQIYKLPLSVPKSYDMDYVEYCEEMEKSILRWKEYESLKKEEK